MNAKNYHFPTPDAWSSDTPHSLDRGDDMELKQVHPEYADEQEKRKQLEDAYRMCLTRIGTLRGRQQEEKTA